MHHYYSLPHLKINPLIASSPPLVTSRDTQPKGDTKMQHVKKVLASLTSAVALTGLTACDTDKHNTYLRVLHASADAPKVNVLIDGKVKLASVDYAQSSGQLELRAGYHTLQLDAILPDGNTVTVLDETRLKFERGEEYNVLAIGKAALLGSGEVDAFAPEIVSREKAMPEGARVQVIHAAPDAPDVDVFITAPGDDLTMATPFADNVPYTASTQAVEVPAGDYQIRITSSVDPETVFFDSGSVSVPSGADWFVAAIPNTGVGSSPVDLLVDTGTGAVVLDDVSTGLELRAVHTISDAPGVDIWVNGTAPAIGTPLYNLEYKENTDYLPLAAGDYSFAVAVSGSDPVAVVDTLSLSGELMSNKSYSALAIGNLGDAMNNDKLLLLEDGDTRRVATEAKLRVIHASTLAGNVDIYLSSDATISSDDVKLANVPYEADTGVLSVNAGSAYVMVTPVDTTTVAIGPAMLPLAGGTLTTLVALDDPESPTSVSVISIDD